MHSCITTLLLTLATLSSAIDPPPLAGPSKLDPPPPPTHRSSFCFDRYSNYWESSMTNVFFNTPDEPNFNFTIVTKYMKFYPRTLGQWLKVKGFQVVNPTIIPDSELCGWLLGEEVVVNGTTHGIVAYKWSGPHRKIGTINSANSTPPAVVPRHHIPTHMHEKVSDDTNSKIGSILRDNAPDADVYYFMTIMLSTACGMLGITMLFHSLFIYGELRRTTREVPKDPEDIELDQIKVHDLSGSGMQRMDSEDDGDGPKFTIEIITSAAASSSMSSIRTCVADPPPIYSIDGAGR